MIKIVVGATAVGKTDWAIDFAMANNSQILSADSMQIYKHMNIGTAKPTIHQQQQVKHYLVDIIDPNQYYSAQNFVSDANSIIDQLVLAGVSPLIVGGTGLYINAFIRKFSFPSVKGDKDLREKLRKLAQEYGNEYLHKKLEAVDPASALRIPVNDVYRVVRALEIFELTNVPMSVTYNKEKEYRDDIELVLINRNREQLYKRIEKRVDLMVKEGLIDEVKQLLKMGYREDLASMKALGYKECVSYLNNNISKQDCIDLIKKRTRNFAKRQLTWFRSFPINKQINLD